MNSQIFPGLSESFIRQEHARLMEEAKRSGLLRQAKPIETARRPQFSWHWMPKHAKLVREQKRLYPA